MLEAEWLQIESQIPVIYCPLLRQAEKLPFSAAFVASMIMSVQFIPCRIFFGVLHRTWGSGLSRVYLSQRSSFSPSEQSITS